eukprot:g19827.t1
MVVPKEIERLKKVMTRIKFDLVRAHPFMCAPRLPLVKHVTEQSVEAASKELKSCVAKTKPRSDELLAQVDPAIRKPRPCTKMDLWEELAEKYCKEDTTSWEVWRDGLDWWCRNGKCLRAIKRGMYGLNSDDYVDDFSAFVRQGMGKVVTNGLLELLDELGLPAMLEKVDFGEELEILEAYYALIKEDADRATSSFEGLADLAGTRKAEAVVKKVLQSSGHLPSGFVENSVTLPHCFKVNRGDHVRTPRCDRKERGRLLLRPEEALDLAVLFKKMHIEGDPYEAESDLTTVVKTSMKGNGGTEIVKEKRFELVVDSKTSKQISVMRPRGLLRLEQEAQPDVTAESFTRTIKRMREVDNSGKQTSKKLKAVQELAADPGKRAEAVGKLDLMVSTEKREAAVSALLERYLEAADCFDAPLGTYESVYQFLACSLGEFKTTASCVREILKSDFCVMNEEEKELMSKQLSMLKSRGHTEREQSVWPITLVDIFEVQLAGKISDSELVMLLLCFYCALRPSECKKMAVDYDGPLDERLGHRWDHHDLSINFEETTIKVNKYKSIRVKCICKELKKENISRRFCICARKGRMDSLSCKQDPLKIAQRVFTGARNVGDHPSFEAYKTVAKKLKNGEAWCIAREWANASPLEKKLPTVEPVHVFAAMATRIKGDNHNPLITTGIRDDLISKYMSAQNGLSKGDAYVVSGEVLMDLQACNADVPGTTYEGRVRRWFEADMENRWREAFRRQERIVRERDQAKQQREQEER